MPLRVEGPPRTEMKPKPWRVNPRYIAPEWRWAWEGMIDHVVCWEGGGFPFTVRQGVQMTAQRGGSYPWADSIYGPYLAVDNEENEGEWLSVGELNSDGQYTLVTHFKTTGRNVDFDIVPGYFGDAAGDAYIHFVDAVGNLFVATKGGNTQGNSTVNCEDDEWHVGISTWDQPAGVIRVYVDGDLQYEVTGYSDTSSDSDARLGFGNYDGSRATVDLLQLGAYEGLWTDAQVRQFSDRPFGPFRRQQIRYTSGPTAGFVTITEDITDTNTVDDTVDDTLTLVEALTSANVITDSVTEQFAAQVISESLSDQIVAADALNENLVLVETLSDGFVVVDSLTDLLTLSETISDATVSADTVGLRITNTDALTDTVSVTDTVSETISGVITEALTDTLSVMDSVDSVAVFSVTLDDQATITDAVTENLISAGVIQETLTDSAVVTDQLDLTATLSEILSDEISLTDSAAESITFIIDLSDSASASDSLSENIIAVVVDHAEKTFRATSSDDAFKHFEDD